MITFATFMERLARGPLKNTAAVEQTNLGEIVPEYHPTILMLTNEGLREISTKKMINTGRVKLTWIENQSDYVLRKVNVGTYLENFMELDELEFTDDLIVRVVELNAYLKNDSTDDYDRILFNSNQGVSLPSYNRIRFSSTFRALYPYGVCVNYQARHFALVDVDDEINLPPNLEYALQLFVASQYILQMSGPEHAKRGDEYRVKYLQEMGEDEAKNLSSVSQIEEDTRFTDRGFV